MKGRTLIVAVVGIALLAGGGYLAYTQVFGPGGAQAPEFGVEDMGDWGEVTEERTEVVHTLWVDNPNPAGVSIGDEVTLEYQVHLNDVAFADGRKEGIEIEPGNNTVRLSSYVRNDELPEFWVAYVRADETIHYRLESGAHVGAGLDVSQDLPDQTGTTLEDKTPVITAVDESVSETEGEYTRSVGSDDLPEDRITGDLFGDEEVTVGYEVRNASAEWGEVTEEETTLLVHYTVHNPSDAVAVPGVPDGLAVSIDVNGNRMFEADGEALSPRNVDEEDVLLPGETRTYTYEIRMDNGRVDEWFTSHVRNDERSTVTVNFQLQFQVGDETFRVPRDGPVSYECEMQTGILVDGQETDTDCGDTPGTRVTGETPTMTPAPDVVEPVVGRDRLDPTVPTRRSEVDPDPRRRVRSTRR